VRHGYTARAYAVPGSANRESLRESRADLFTGLCGRTETQVKRVLIVDDHDLFRQVLGVVLEWHTDFKETVQAESLAEARLAIGGANSKIDLAIIDVDLPGEQGFKLIRELCEEKPRVPVIAMTAGQDHERYGRALKSGAMEVLTTMATGEEIIDVARRLEDG
jgi:DNA-binding NarL/FixJ family response regulator